MSNEESIVAKAQARIQWHRAEIARLQGIIEKLQEAIQEFGEESQIPLPGAAAPTKETARLTWATTPPAHTDSPFIQYVTKVLRDGEALSSREIADRLKQVGYKSEASDYYPTVYNQLVWWDRKGVGVQKIGDRASGVLFRRR